MKPKRAIPIAFLIVILVGLCPAEDIIKLKNGNSFRGIIREESDDMIRVEIKAGMMMTFPKGDVAEIVRGKHPPPPPKPTPQPNPKPEEPQPEPEEPTREGIQENVARLIYDGEFAEAEKCCGEAERDVQLQDVKPQIAALREDIRRLEKIWQKVKAALPAMKGKEILFRDGIGAPMVALKGNRVVAQAGLNRPVHELDPELALSLADITDPATRGMVFFYAHKWDAAKEELQRAGMEAGVQDYLQRIDKAVAAEAQETRQRAASAEKKKERLESLAERRKATADVFRLTRRAETALADRKFQEALQLLQEARNIAAQSLPEARVKVIDKDIQEVVEYSRIVLDIAIENVYISPGHLDQAVQTEKKDTRERGEHWSRDRRRETEQKVQDAIIQHVGSQIAAAVAQPLQAFGYMVVHPNQLKRGDRSSVLRILYREYGIVGDVNPWTPPMPGPVWPVYGVSVHIDCTLELLDPHGRTVWGDEISLTTPLSTGDGALMSLSSRVLLFQQLQMLTFQPEEK